MPIQIAEDEMRKRIIICLSQDTINVFHPAPISIVAMGVYLNDYISNQGYYNNETFELLSKMEREPNPLVKNTNKVPGKDRDLVIKGSRWVLTSKL